MQLTKAKRISLLDKVQKSNSGIKGIEKNIWFGMECQGMHKNWAKSTQCYQKQDSYKGGFIYWAILWLSTTTMMFE